MYSAFSKLLPGQMSNRRLLLALLLLRAYSLAASPTPTSGSIVPIDKITNIEPAPTQLVVVTTKEGENFSQFFGLKCWFSSVKHRKTDAVID